jgi:hypothetical protein
VRSGQGLVVPLGADAHEELVAQDPAEHLAFQEEGEPAEHLLLGDSLPASRGEADACREPVIVGHAPV